MKAAFYTLGCKVNHVDSGTMGAALASAGWEIVGPAAQADAYIINSCTVTTESDRKTRQAVRRFRRSRPDAVIVLAGCFAQAFPDKAAALGADIVTGNKDAAQLPGLLERFLTDRCPETSLSPHIKGESFEETGQCFEGGRTRAVVKIEDGCDRFCAYCILPYARGPVRSRSLLSLRGELALLEAAGFPEVVLTGINLAAFGSDTGNCLYEAAEMACSFKGFKRVRLGSLEPDLLTGELIEKLSKLPKLCPNFHISLQSGCGRTLKSMNRRYTPAQFEAVVSLIRGAFPGAAITTDVIAGFPGESEEDFAETLAFVKQMAFEKVHIFPFSARPGTAAELLPGAVDRGTIQKRCRELSAAAQEIRSDFLLLQVGKTVAVLLEQKGPDGLWTGYTPNYTPVAISGEGLRRAMIVAARVTGADSSRCVAEV